MRIFECPFSTNEVAGLRFGKNGPEQIQRHSGRRPVPKAVVNVVMAPMAAESTDPIRGASIPKIASTCSLISIVSHGGMPAFDKLTRTEVRQFVFMFHGSEIKSLHQCSDWETFGADAAPPLNSRGNLMSQFVVLGISKSK